jgi:hypothetical protein
MKFIVIDRCGANQSHELVHGGMLFALSKCAGLEGLCLGAFATTGCGKELWTLTCARAGREERPGPSMPLTRPAR